jgi:membrane protein YqaA with SNARE-associated domain
MPDELGPLGLFLSAFLAATLLPFSSEAALIAALHYGMDPFVALLSASSGNLLAIMLNFALGWWLYERTHARLERSRWGQKALKWSHEKGYWALLLSPLPIIGDPITLAAGMARLNVWWFLLIAGALRVGRYWLIVASLA